MSLIRLSRQLLMVVMVAASLLTLGCSGGGSSPSPVPPAAPTITVPGCLTSGQAYMASVPAEAGCTDTWSILGGTLSGAASGPRVTFMAGSSGTVQLSCIVTNGSGLASAPGTVVCSVVAAPAQPIVTAPAQVGAGQGALATVADQPGSTFTWTLSGGTIQGSATGTTLAFTAGSSGTVQLSCVATNSAGSNSPAGTVSCAIVRAAAVPVITAPGNITAGQSGTASVPVQAGCTYGWTISGGSIQGSAMGSDLTFTAGNSGAVQLSCVAINGLGLASSAGTASCAIVSAAAIPVIAAPSSITAGQSGTASVPAQVGCTYGWTISGGSIQGSATGSSVAFTAGNNSSVQFSCVATNALGQPSSAGVASCAIVPAAAIPVITAVASLTAGQSSMASVPSQAGCTFSWTISGGAIQGGATGNTLSFVVGNSGSVQLSCAAVNGLGVASLAGTATCAIFAAPTAPTITAPSCITAGQSSTATVPGQVGCTYRWGISGGTLQGDATGNTVVYTAGSPGALSLSCSVVNQAGSASPQGVASSIIVAAPTAPVVQVQTQVTAGYLSSATATVPAGCTYAWTITGGTIQGGASGSSLLFIPGSGPSVQLTCTATNAAGTVSSAGTATCTILPVPGIPVISAPAYVTTGKTYGVTIQPQSGVTYTWSIVNGVPVGGTTGASFSFTAGTANVQLSCSASNGAGGSALSPVTVCVACVEPSISSFSAARNPCTAGFTTLVSCVYAGGSGQISTDAGPCQVGLPSFDISPSASTTYTLTVTNQAGDSVSRQLSVAVVPAPVITHFSATPNRIPAGSSTTLTATYSNGTATIDGGVGSVPSGAGVDSGILYGPATYTLTVTNALGDSVSQEISVLALAPGSCTATGSMTSARTGFTLTQLPNGKLLAAGGSDGSAVLASADIYDVATGRFTSTGSMTAPRFCHSATLLQNGKVLIVGGGDLSHSASSSAELYDPQAGTFTAVGSLTLGGRACHVACLLPDGQVLVAGGTDATGVPLASAERFDPAAQSFTATGTMAAGRSELTATLLLNGKVLMGGGIQGGNSPLLKGELFDPATGQFSLVGPMSVERYSPLATLLPSGKVLFAGGLASNVLALSTSECYDPALGTFATTGSMSYQRNGGTATLLPDANVFVAGGSLLASSYGELFLPMQGIFECTGLPTVSRSGAKACLLPTGQVLLTGGIPPATGPHLPYATAELFNPSDASPYPCFSYNPPVYAFASGGVIAPITPNATGVTAWTVSPALPAGLILDPNTGILSGSPAGPSSPQAYIVTASNGTQTMQAPLWITVN